MTQSTDFVKNLGFNEDPFARYNADQETRLSEYFVPPPYFADVFGDASDPQSFFVFAPRGGGKSAQRIMIENRCAEESVLSLTYDDFDLFPVNTASAMSLEHHVKRILRIGFLGLLVSLADEPTKSAVLSKEEKSLLAKRIEIHVESLSLAEVESTLKSLRSITDKISRFFNKYRPFVGTAANAISQQVLGTNALLPHPASVRQEKFNPKYELGLLAEYARKIGYKSVYVLVDKVDESELTGNSVTKSFELLEPMVRSLHILETEGIAFKFFLWDAIEPKFTQVTRPDRIKYRTLKWDNETLKTLLQKRLMAYSNRTVRKLDTIADSLRPHNLDELAVIFANRSPRDLIRVCQKVVAEQQQIDSEANLLGTTAIHKGIDEFCNQRVSELYESNHIKQFRIIGSHANQVDFTIRYLSTDIYKREQNAIRPKIKKWRDDGYIEDLGYIPSDRNPTGRHVKLFGVCDIRLARVMTLSISTAQFLDEKVKICENCNVYVVRDWGQGDSMNFCHICGYNWETQTIDPNFVPISDDDTDIDFPQQWQLL